MILVITPETLLKNETDIINEMFREGLDLLHIRKPVINREEMKTFLDGIHSEFYDQLVLHGYYDLGTDYTVARLHFREADRLAGNYKPYADKNIISTSVHDIETFNELGKEWEYAFISPFFPSISKKGYGLDSSIMEDVKRNANPDVKLVALGGINENNIDKVFENGADGAALLGGIWESDEPLNAFKKCRKKVLLS
ncbi:thiamine phosphate pyrophosphorylase [Chryseobacterium angstadtii]|uniref:Thiamine phosphate pyrophosphorylase n=1 Tax=Chryseobacterium angstadtii TaxID=558151 RepID=A0A0J7LD63_9FLAO|nr:thiamine phosphate synthase [Chryseobacterium angstadtii]KMQ66840.1 thiamine phosphate pyrophosphorylase [Chryseobacterium angstadtii]